MQYQLQKTNKIHVSGRPIILSRDCGTFDFETYSEAGLVFDHAAMKWRSPDPDAAPGSQKKGLKLVGAWVYSEHPSTEVLCMSYRIPGRAIKRWTPRDPNPVDLFNWLASGGKMEAHSAGFEFAIWWNVCRRRYNWPDFPLSALRDSVALARAFSIPGALDNATKALHGEQIKDPIGKELIRLLCVPKKPSRKNPSFRHTPANPPAKYPNAFELLQGYCDQDVVAEESISGVVPPLTPFELALWQLDQRINFRGVQIDRDFVRLAIAAVRSIKLAYGRELFQLTDGAVGGVSKTTDIMRFVYKDSGREMTELSEDAIVEFLARNPNLPDRTQRVLHLRQKGAGSAVAKFSAMEYTSSTKDDRIRGVHEYQGADRTGRWAGRMVQTQNLPNKGPKLTKCTDCGGIYDAALYPKDSACPRGCSLVGYPAKLSALDWGIEGIETIIQDTKAGMLFQRWSDPMLALTGALRGAFVAKEGYEFISSDFSAIEGVVLACLAGEEWKIQAYRDHGKMYELIAAKISGVPFEEILEYKERTGSHHPLRKKVGKFGELASGFQGGIGAWKAFGADEFLTDKEIKEAVKMWRREHPAIVALWHGLEDAAKNAIRYPGTQYPYRDISYVMNDGALWCYLPSGRALIYHRAALEPEKVLSSEGWDIVNADDGDPTRNRHARAFELAKSSPGAMFYESGVGYSYRGGELTCQTQKGTFIYPLNYHCQEAIKDIYFDWRDKITFYGNNSAPKKGSPRGFVKLDTYGGKLAENCTQAAARDILGIALLNIEAAGFPVVLHIHDEAVAEVPIGSKTVEELERIMSTPPLWAADWPIKAAGGWIGKRFRKD